MSTQASAASSPKNESAIRSTEVPQVNYEDLASSVLLCSSPPARPSMATKSRINMIDSISHSHYNTSKKALREELIELEQAINLEILEVKLQQIRARREALIHATYVRKVAEFDPKKPPSLEPKGSNLVEYEDFAHRYRTEVRKTQADAYNVVGHYNAHLTAEKLSQNLDGYIKLGAPFKVEREKLNDAYRLQQFLCDVEDEQDWIREKVFIVESNNVGCDLVGVKNLIECHLASSAEIAGKKPRIEYVIEEGNAMVKAKHYAEPKIIKRVEGLRRSWDELCNKNEKRRQLLDDSLQIKNYFTDASEAERWMREKEALVEFNEFGRDEYSTEALFNTHKALMNDMEAYGSTIESLREQASNCRMQETTSVDILGNDVVIALYDYRKQPPRDVSMRKGNCKDWFKDVVNKRQGLVPAAYVGKVDALFTNSHDDLLKKPLTVARQQQRLEEQYQRLLQLGNDHRERLRNSIEAYQLVGKAIDLHHWIVDKRLNVFIKTILPGSFEEVESERKKVDKLFVEKNERQARVIEMCDKVGKLKRNGRTKAVEKIEGIVLQLRKKYEQLDEVITKKAKDLDDIIAVQRYHRMYDEEKECRLLLDEHGTDRTSAQRLFKKHDASEPDIMVLSYRVKTVDVNATDLVQLHPQEAEVICCHQDAINTRMNAFENLKLSGKELIDNGQNDSPAVEEALAKVARDKQQLDYGCLKRQKVLEKCIEEQWFLHECVQAERWTVREISLADGKKVNVLIRKHEYLNRAINLKESIGGVG